MQAATAPSETIDVVNSDSPFNPKKAAYLTLVMIAKSCIHVISFRQSFLGEKPPPLVAHINKTQY